MSKHIDHIEIKNFKSIREQTISGCRKINVFIGYPNVGKSNILEALSTLSYLQKYDVHFSKLCRLEGFSELFFNGDIENSASINLIDKYSFIFQYSSEEELDLIIVQLSLTEKAMIKGVKFKNGERSENVENEDFINAPIVKKYHYESRFNKRRTSGLSLSSPSGENLFDVIELNPSIRKEVLELFEFYGLKLAFDKNTNSLKILKSLEDGTLFLIPFHQVADTLQRLIFYKAAILSNKETALLFEEPEVHMFPPYVNKFTTDVVSDDTNQFFISTHSPYVLNEFIEEAKDDLSIYLVGYQKGETIIKRMTEEQVTELYSDGIDLFFNIESYFKDGQADHV